MVLAIDLYEEEAPKEFCPYTIFALKKLRQFVDSRKEMTAQSYRFFVEHAYNQFFHHEARHFINLQQQEPRPRTLVQVNSKHQQSLLDMSGLQARRR